ncbi:MAG: DUF418 domain-containing protein [Deltaproteobacteria bacterium]|nr:DUF418 domain-containing protein [Deltaproteobacteria bacterium]
MSVDESNELGSAGGGAASRTRDSRIVGFDLARAYAILGMYIVNFQGVYGAYDDPSPIGRFVALFAGNSSSAFVLMAGIGCSLLTWRPSAEAGERRRLRLIVVRRSWFLFFSGLALCTWWPPDILHFYGGYMHIAALLLFASGRALLVAAAACVVLFHALLVVVPYETGWNFDTLQYAGFWTPRGFVRNTIYNGWNPILPWAAFFFVGMWLGRCDWKSKRFRVCLVLVSAIAFGTCQVLIQLATRGYLPTGLAEYVTADYLPPFLVFMASTGSFALLMVCGCVALGERFEKSRWVRALAATGQCTFTLYVGHLTIGLLVLGALVDRPYWTITFGEDPLSSWKTLGFSVVSFAASVLACAMWRARWRHGPLEWLMRRVCG